MKNMDTLRAGHEGQVVALTDGARFGNSAAKGRCEFAPLYRPVLLYVRIAFAPFPQSCCVLVSRFRYRYNPIIIITLV